MAVQMPAACLLPGGPRPFMPPPPPGIARINSICVAAPPCHQISSSSCDNVFGGRSDSGGKNVDESTVDLAKVNNKWRSVPEVKR